jgi:hypothetical protein
MTPLLLTTLSGVVTTVNPTSVPLAALGARLPVHVIVFPTFPAKVPAIPFTVITISLRFGVTADEMLTSFEEVHAFVAPGDVAQIITSEANVIVSGLTKCA